MFWTIKLQLYHKNDCTQYLALKYTIYLFRKRSGEQENIRPGVIFNVKQLFWIVSLQLTKPRALVEILPRVFPKHLRAIKESCEMAASKQLSAAVFRKKPSRGVLRKRCSKYMLQIYRREPMPKCDFYKVAKHSYWNQTSAWLFPVNLLYIFRTPFPKNTCGGLRLPPLGLHFRPAIKLTCFQELKYMYSSTCICCIFSENFLIRTPMDGYFCAFLVT